MGFGVVGLGSFEIIVQGFGFGFRVILNHRLGFGVVGFGFRVILSPRLGFGVQV